MARSTGKRKVTWNAGEKKSLLPYPYVPGAPVETEVIPPVGALAIATVPMFEETIYSSNAYRQHDSKYLIAMKKVYPGYSYIALPGTPLIFMGVVRVQEQGKFIMSVQRFSFLIGSKRYMVRSLKNIEFATGNQ